LRTRNEAIAANIAKRIAASKTRLRFSTLHRLAIEETMSVDLSNNAAPLRKNAVGSPADGKKMSDSNQQGSSTTSGMSVGSQIPVAVKPVDRLTITGSTPGDHRAPALAADITAFAKNSPNPRENVGQFPLSARTPAAPAPITTVDDSEVGG
jgi:hypothetical protein